MTMRTTLKVQKQRTIVSNVEHKLLLINWTFQFNFKVNGLTKYNSTTAQPAQSKGVSKSQRLRVR